MLRGMSKARLVITAVVIEVRNQGAGIEVSTCMATVLCASVRYGPRPRQDDRSCVEVVAVQRVRCTYGAVRAGAAYVASRRGGNCAIT